jgi:cysteine-rich repeat protein
MSRWNKTLGCTALAAAGLLLGCGDDGGPPANCGDGVVQMAEGEQCDDGNVELGDGCSNLCTEEPGFECEGEPSECLPVGECGNGVVNFGEECDDGMMTAACNPDCTVSECGDGFPNSAAGEECDDGNVTPGDGCASTCLVEPDTCGNGACELEGEETCGNCPTDCAANPACNDCEDADEDGFFAVECGGFDCADDNPDINPGMAEIPCNDVDDDCSPATTDFGDSDGDGSACDEDCDDTDPMRSPDFMEVCGNDVDDDCDPSTPDVQDADSDGFACDVDCDDGNAMVNPEADEVCDNFQDDDCDPSTFDLFDGDGDGWQCQLDCDDGDMTVVPGETDADGDGVTCERDCNDGNENVSPNEDEICGNGIDDDCDPSTPDLFDMDGDGARCDEDCDDNDPNRSPMFREICANGIDDDCDETTTDDPVDSDGDGATCDVDCDDMDPSIVPDELNRCGPAFEMMWSFDADDGGWTTTGSAWEWGEPTAEFIPAAAAGTGAWVTNLDGDYPDDANATLESPSMDLSGLITDPVLKFEHLFQTESCCDEGWVEISTDGGMNWRKLGTADDGVNWYNDEGDDVWNDESGEPGEWRTAALLLRNTAGFSDVRVRFVFQSDFLTTEEGFGVDEVLVSNQDIDLSLDELEVASGQCADPSVPVTVTISNVGAVPVSDYQVSYTIDGGEPVVETPSTLLDPGDSITVEFGAPADLSATGEFAIASAVSTAMDSIAANDVLFRTVTSAPFVTITDLYSEGFETGPGGWVTSGEPVSSWEVGTPDAAFIDAANSGDAAWVTNLDGDFANDELSFLTSPCFDMSALGSDPLFRFAHIFDTGGSFDEGWVEISADGGSRWRKLGEAGQGLNWYNDDSDDTWNGESGDPGAWRTAQILVAGVAGEDSVRLRFVFDASSFSADEGFGVDDVQIGSDITDLAVVDADVPSATCASPDVGVQATIANLGASDVASFEVSYRVDGGAPVTETVSDGLAAGDTMMVSFATTADLSALGPHALEVRVTATDDSFAPNDTVVVDSRSLPVVAVDSAGYAEDFEADDGDWLATGENVSWEWGMPDDSASGVSIITEAASGMNAWVTNLSGDYENNEESAVESPCFDFSSLSSDPVLSFSHLFETESSFDEGWIEVSLDGGETWSKLGAAGEGTNWYNDTEDDWWHDMSASSWRTASHLLDGTAGEARVRIRHRFASDGSVTREGFGLDDVMVMP